MSESNEEVNMTTFLVPLSKEDKEQWRKYAKIYFNNNMSNLVRTAVDQYTKNYLVTDAFDEMKKGVKRRKIYYSAEELLEVNPDLTKSEVAEELGVTIDQLNDALNNY